MIRLILIAVILTLAGCKSLSMIKHDRQHDKVIVGSTYDDMIHYLGVPAYNGGKTTCSASQYGARCYHTYTTHPNRYLYIEQNGIIESVSLF